MINYKQLLFFVVILSALLEKGTTIKCYKCTSSNRDSNCGYPTDTNGVEIDQCPTNNSKCFHYDYNVDGQKGFEQFVERGCMIGTSNSCPVKPLESPTLNYQCKMCHEEKCNNEGTMLKRVNDTGSGGNNEGGNDDGSSITPTFVVIWVGLLMLIKNIC